MADRASGPVKPPIIDLTARSAARAEADKTAANDPAPGVSRRAETPARALHFDDANWPLLGAVAAGGAVLGTILTYIVATLLPLPVHLPPQPPDLSAAVSGQGQQLASLNTAVGDLKTQATRTQVSLDATIATLDGDMAGLNKQVADLKAAMPAAAPPVDLAPLETELKTLKAQVDAIDAGASGADASAIAQSLATLQTSVQTVTTRLNGIDGSIGTLRTDLDAARKTLADHINAALPTEVGPSLKLPLLLSGLQSAFDSGRPFQAELDTLTAVMPGMMVPDALKAAAASGLSRPDALLQKFENTLPDILGARDTGSGDWTQNAVDWAKSLLALRPAEEETGDSPEAVASRLEGAMQRHDYAAAAALLGQLPPRMQQAATPVAGDIAAHAAADQLIADLRSRALAAAGASS